SAQRAKDCHSLGEFQLTGIRKAARGEPRIEVSFEIDANGILRVRATDLDTKRSQDVTCTSSVCLDKAELERMKADLELHVEEDAQRKVVIDLRQHAERVEYDVRRWLEFNRAMMPPRAAKQLEAALGKLHRKVEAEDGPGIKAALKRLDSLSTPLRRSG
ncbi:MAG: Hsp70 family protein, partial [Planctomycetota bacterium]